MFFLLSGEGNTDMGAGRNPAMICEGEDFIVGPMAEIVAKIVEANFDYSILDGGCGFISEKTLTNRAAQLKAVKKQLQLTGKKKAKETHYYFNNARSLARIAKEWATKNNVEVFAILFRDADGTASAGRGEWEQKRKSMLDGFEEEDFAKGVPMIPRPKSEAWLICAWKKNSYQGCEALEERSGNDNSPNNLKSELSNILNQDTTHELLREKVKQSLDIDNIDMPSFKAFRKRLEEVIVSNHS